MRRPSTSFVFLFFLLIAALAGCNEERTSVGPDDRWNREIAAPKNETNVGEHSATLGSESSSMAPGGAGTDPTADASSGSALNQRQ